MDVRIESSWRAGLQSEFDQPYFAKLTHFVRQEYRTKTIFPPARLIFNAFEQTPLSEVKVVILGQDPYHNFGQAHGLSFSVAEGVQIPPSLVNIFKEIEVDLGVRIPTSGDLTRWANQGVLLLNATLTVEAHKAGSHQGRGWETFTDAVIRLVSERCEGVVFLLWGSYAQKKSVLVDSGKHLVLKAPHPSPLSAYRGFFGCKHFSQANAYLSAHDKTPIEW